VTKAPRPIRRLERYALYEAFASGGMASVHFGRITGPGGFSRVVAIKQLHRELAADPEFTAMLADEARLAARVRHRNVVSVLDVVAVQGQLFVVLEYVHGASLAYLLERAEAPPPPPVAAAIVHSVLLGLSAAHEAVDVRGEPLGIVHRDVSPQNVLVEPTGTAKLVDFGVAQARARAQRTRQGEVKGKLGYLAPEQLEGRATPRSDLFAASIVLWEALTGRRLFPADEDRGIRENLLASLVPRPIEPPGRSRPDVPSALDDVVLRGLSFDPEARFDSAHAMALALERSVPLATPAQVGAWVAGLLGAELEERAATVEAIEAAPGDPDDDDDPVRDRVRAAAPAPARRPSAAPRGTRRARAAAAVGIVCALAALVALRPRAGGAPKAAAPTVEVPSAEVDEPSAPPGVATAPEALPPTTATAASVAPRAPRRTTTLPPRPSRAEASCSPPYTVDVLGLRHYKPACLK
jgi:serine/threonine-protein kinase